MKKTSYQKLKEENARLKSDLLKIIRLVDGVQCNMFMNACKSIADSKLERTDSILDRSSNAEDKGFVTIPEPDIEELNDHPYFDRLLNQFKNRK